MGNGDSLNYRFTVKTDISRKVAHETGMVFFKSTSNNIKRHVRQSWYLSCAPSCRHLHHRGVRYSTIVIQFRLLLLFINTNQNQNPDHHHSQPTFWSIFSLVLLLCLSPNSHLLWIFPFYCFSSFGGSFNQLLSTKCFQTRVATDSSSSVLPHHSLNSTLSTLSDHPQPKHS